MSSTMATEVPSTCRVCGEPSSLKCSRCKVVYYCSKAHQESDWKSSHKKACFPPDSICTRCNESTASAPKCHVPHPPHMLEDAGSGYGPGGAHFSFVCRACNKGFTRSSRDLEMKTSDMPIVRGPTWCFQGNHTIKPVSDNRRVFNDVVQLFPGSLQEDIEALDGSQVRVLKICYNGFASGNPERPALNRSLSALEELLIEGIDMSEIILNETLTPKLKSIKLTSVSEECNHNFSIVVPTLEVFHLHYYGPSDDYTWVIRMLENAPNLVEFDSYKLRVPFLGFYSNRLKTIRLHRAELLERVVLWAPSLVHLNVQAAYDLNEIHFLKDHALKAQLPSNFCCNDQLRVDTTNAILGEQAVAELNAHPRVSETIENDDAGTW